MPGGTGQLVCLLAICSSVGSGSRNPGPTACFARPVCAGAPRWPAARCAMHINHPPCLPLPLQVVSETSAPALSYEELLESHPSGEAHEHWCNSPRAVLA